MGFDWEGSVEHYGDALDALAARLVTMAGILWGRPVEMLPRRLYLEILAILRPAEFALRRLIVMAAWKVVPEIGLPPATEEGEEPPRTTLPPCGGESDFDGLAEQTAKAKRQKSQERGFAPSFGPSGHLLPRGEKEGASRRRATASGLPLTTETTEELKGGTSGAHQQGQSPQLKDGTPGARQRATAKLKGGTRKPPASPISRSSIRGSATARHF
ncbi:hypothetical protein [Oricola cellulosilytica]|uniref:Uncharacterized protein n=1 Tax=Oricola cellulosilytica TaxID=1429082 RepID=A0A4R0P962_9HYPH|nr:hypothetical protein [Oricola cellulosilytica]TCD13719.1 hypothetical protein E0D97_11455 [Oricola cellulosilytica]